MGLYYYGARWYDPYLNQWTSPDPIIQDPENPLDWNRYTFVRNNPINFNDPTGYDVFCPGEEADHCSDGKPNTVHTPRPSATVKEVCNFGKCKVYVMDFDPNKGSGYETWINPKGIVIFNPHPNGINPDNGTDERLLGQITGDILEFYTGGIISGNEKGQIGLGVGDLHKATEEDYKKQDIFVFPATAGEMDIYLGFTGERVPDLPYTPGRNKVIWKPSDQIKITFEQHPYDVGAPASHSGPHWHLEIPGLFGHQPAFVPGENMP